MRRRFIVFGFILLVPATFLIAWICQPQHPVNQANYERIEDGMSEEEVMRILGGPATEESRGEFGNAIKYWAGFDRDTILVYFTFDDGKWIVTGKHAFFPTLLDRVKEWWGGFELHPDGGRSKRLEVAS